MTDEKTKQSKYHGSKLYIERLDKICQALNQVTLMRESCEEDKKILYWKSNYSVLVAFYKELNSEMPKSLQEKHKKAFKVIKKNFQGAMNQLNKKSTCSTNFINLFDDWEILLRQFQSDKGLLMPDVEEGIVEDDV